jgi:HSP20 family protein
MSFPDDIDPYNFFRQFFGGGGRRRGERRGWTFDDMFREFDEMRKDMSKMFSEQFKNIEDKVPKDLIKEYETPEGGKVREVGPIVYGYSMTIGPDGKPKIREFGNVKSFAGRGFFEQPSLSAEREPLIDISSTEKEVKIVAEMPGISKEKIRIDSYDNSVEIKSEDPNRKYHKTIEVPEDIDIESAKSNLTMDFRNNIQKKRTTKNQKVDK